MPIYLDHNSTTPILPEALQAMLQAEQVGFANPASSHGAGRAARRLLEESREGIAALLGASPSEVIFTSGATEANNLALFGLPFQGTALASPIEHPCITGPLQQLQQQGNTVDYFNVDGAGKLNVVEALPKLTSDVGLICLMMVNHETGTIQPVRHIAKVRPKTSLMHCDAAQAAGKLPINFADLGVTSLTVSAHKFGGPRGIGALILKSGIKLKPQLFGGHQQRGLRPGTEPVPLVAGMHAALKARVERMSHNLAHLRNLRETLFTKLQQEVAPVVLNGADLGSSDALPTTLNVSFPGCRADLLLVSLDLAGIACSTGSACSSGSLLPSPVLQAMKVSESVLLSAIRFSFSPSLSLEDISEAANLIIRAVRQVRQPRQDS